MSSSSLDASTSGGGTASTPPITSSSSSPSTPTSGTPSDAAARREARKARILGKGTDRLAKLTKQARGDEAELLYPSTPPPAVGGAPSQARKAGGRGDEDDPEEIDISDQARMDQQMEGAMQAWQRQQQQQSAAGQGQGGQPMPQDPFAQMMAALTGGGAGSGASGGEAGMGGMPDLSQLFAAMQQQQQQQGQPGQASADGMPPLPPFMQQRQPAPTSWLSTRFFSLLHTVVFLALGYFAVSTALLGVPTAQQHMDVAMREVESRQRLNSWASLAYYRPNTVASATATGGGGVQARHFDIDGARVGLEGPVPLFLLFLLLELFLQSLRFLLLPSPFAGSTSPHGQQAMDGSPLSMLLNFLPPTLRFVVVTGKRWLTLLGTCVDDVAVLVFVLGCGTIWCAAQVKG